MWKNVLFAKVGIWRLSQSWSRYYEDVPKTGKTRTRHPIWVRVKTGGDEYEVAGTSHRHWYLYFTSLLHIWKFILVSASAHYRVRTWNTPRKNIRKCHSGGDVASHSNENVLLAKPFDQMVIKAYHERRWAASWGSSLELVKFDITSDNDLAFRLCRIKRIIIRFKHMHVFATFDLLRHLGWQY